MPDRESPSARYRRLAQECWKTAHTFPDGDGRTVLLEMAQVWQRLAVDHANSTAPFVAAPEGQQTAMQQQQQVQPKDDKKE